MYCVHIIYNICVYVCIYQHPALCKNNILNDDIILAENHVTDSIEAWHFYQKNQCFPSRKSQHASVRSVSHKCVLSTRKILHRDTCKILPVRIYLTGMNNYLLNSSVTGQNDAAAYPASSPGQEDSGLVKMEGHFPTAWLLLIRWEVQLQLLPYSPQTRGPGKCAFCERYGSCSLQLDSSRAQEESSSHCSPSLPQTVTSGTPV